MAIPCFRSKTRDLVPPPLTFGVGWLLTLCCLGVPVHADEASPRQRLDQVERRISGLERSIAADRREQERLRGRLEDIERRIAELDRSRTELERRLADLRDKAERLRVRRQVLSRRLADQRRQLGRQIEARYLLSRQGGALGVLMTGAGGVSRGRLMDYYAYLQAGLSDEFMRTRQTRERLARLEQGLDETTTRIQGLLERRRAEQAQWRRQREERRRLLAQLDGQITDKSGRLAEARRAQERLQALLRRLESAPRAVPESGPMVSFAGQKGALPWPVEGRVVAHFGRRRSRLGPRWRGIVIASRRGRPVQAVFAGRVVFADWLRGFGQLVIIDHGHGYLTLYGHNQSLLKRRGDPVAQGESIARIGDTGGQTRPGLYFEIRHQGRPEDPLPWFAPSG